MLRIHNVKIGLHQKEYKKVISQTLNIREKEIVSVKLVKKSVDARHQRICFICSFDFEVKDEQKVLQNYSRVRQVNILDIPTPKHTQHYVVVGQGLVGMLCAYILSQHHQKVTVIEQGLPFEERLKQPLTYDNLCFGEGGSSLFLQEQWLLGKNQPIIRFIIDLLMECGISSEVVNLSKFYLSHRDIILVLRFLKEQMKAQDVRFCYQSQCIDFDNTDEPYVKILHEGKEEIITCDDIIFAHGQYNKETMTLLEKHHMTFDKKSDSFGLVLRVLQEDVNAYQYGEHHHSLPPADYTYHNRKLQISLQNLYPYSQVLSQEGLHMIKDETSPYVHYQLMIHHDFSENDNMTFNTRPDELGVQSVEDFLLGKESSKDKLLENEYLCDYTKLLPKECVQRLQTAFDEEAFQQRAMIVGITSHQSIRIQKDAENTNSLQHIHVIGKGTGYHKNTMSALCDGIQCAIDVLKGE